MSMYSPVKYDTIARRMSITFVDEPDTPYDVRVHSHSFAVLTRAMTEDDRENFEWEGPIEKA